MSIVSIRHLAVASLAVLLAACGGESGGEKGAAKGGDSAAAAAGDSAAGAPRQAAVPSPRTKAPAIIRGLYVNAYKAGSGTHRKRLIEIADQTEINAFVVDVKDERGLHYVSNLTLQNEMTEDSEITIRNPKAFTDTLHAHGIWVIARIVVFKDPILSKAQPDWSVKNPSGGLWVDKAGNTWVSPWDERVWDYNLDIAEEVARLGFDEIQFDYVRFAEPYRSLPNQVHPRAKGDRTDAIAAFLNEAKRRLHPLGVTVTADVFGLSPNEGGDVNIGQQWETISAIADHILPMMYPSHYFPTHLPGVQRPDLMPYEVLFKSAGMARWRSDQLRDAGVQPARIMPWLQAFSAPWLGRNHQKYGPEQLRQQKQGVYDVGLEDWVLWHPGSNYEHIVAGLATGEAQPQGKQNYTPPADVMSWLQRFEREGVSAARAKAVAQARGDVTDPAAAQAAKAGRPEPAEPGAPKNDVAPGQNAPAEAAPSATGTPAAGGQTNPSNPAQNRSPRR
ncbi:putative glycoside hydrolase [Longimicrobium sp.]|uniref:putative glycoside hydrolase n=1 Tax=Longimicrobium sp. TaxID=2029185 RepID=UPI003B3A4E86